MARIYPFRALRYNLAHVSAQDVVAQPYDEITPAMQQAYYGRSPYNVARVIRRLPELFDGDGDLNGNAARDFADWRRAGILAQERQPCVFAYSQRFEAPGAPGVCLERKGFIALGELCEWSQGVVFRHEREQAGLKSDRLNLLRAVRAEFGPMLMLYSDPGETAEDLLFGDGAGEVLPDVEVTDEYGVLHRVWKVSDAGKINLLAALLEDKKLIVADGQNRYEAALQYARERRLPGPAEGCERSTASLAQPVYPESAALMTFVNLDAEGLVILPAHRVVFGLEPFDAGQMLACAQPYFTMEKLAGGDPAEAVARLAGIRPAAGFVAVTAGGWYLLTARADGVAEALVAVTPRARQLSVVQLERLIFGEALGLAPEAIDDEGHVHTVRDAAEAADMVARGEANAAFLLNPVTMDQVREIAFAGEVMPPKSTEFFPKLLSGLAIYALD